MTEDQVARADAIRERWQSIGDTERRVAMRVTGDARKRVLAVARAISDGIKNLDRATKDRVVDGHPDVQVARVLATMDRFTFRSDRLPLPEER